MLGGDKAPRLTKKILLFSQVNDLIEHPPDPSQVEAMLSGGQSAFPPGLGGLQLQNLLGGAAANPQLLEQLLNSGAVPPPGMLPLEALRYVHNHCFTIGDTSYPTYVSGRGLSALQQLSSGGRGQQQGSSSSHAPLPSASAAPAPPPANQSQQQPQASNQTQR